MFYPHVPAVIPSVGNRIIDSGHKRMFDIIHRIQHSIMAKDCAAIAADFKLLKDAARACFSTEEEIARAVGFDFFLHNLAHRNLLEKYRLLEDELAARNGSWSSIEDKTYAMAISDWLVAHLNHESRPLMCVLDTYFYDFKPA